MRAVLELVGTTRFVDLVLAGVLVEAVGLGVYRRRTGRGMPLREVASFLGAGAALLLAMRALAASAPAAAGARLPFAAAMGVALVCHLWHLAQRWNV